MNSPTQLAFGLAFDGGQDLLRKRRNREGHHRRHGYGYRNQHLYAPHHKRASFLATAWLVNPTLY